MYGLTLINDIIVIEYQQRFGTIPLTVVKKYAHALEVFKKMQQDAERRVPLQNIFNLLTISSANWSADRMEKDIFDQNL